MQVRTWRHGQEIVVYDAALLATPSGEVFDLAWWRARAGVGGSFDGRSKVYIVQHGEQQWVLREYLRGGLIAKLSRNAYVWTGLERTRPWREWHLLASLWQQGLPVPRPVAAQVRRRGVTYNGHLLTELIVGAAPFSSLLEQGQATRAHWQALGHTLKRFGDAGVHHPDLNVRNLLVDAQGVVSVLDFDQGHLQAEAGQFARDIARLKRSVDKFYVQHPQQRADAADWQALLTACGLRGER